MKDPLYFVVDRISTARAVDQLAQTILSNAELRWAALIDAAFDYPESTNGPYVHSGVNCFQFEEFDGLADAAPWLVPIDLSGQLGSQVAALIRHCQERPMLSFIGAKCELETISQRWRPLHMVKVVDAQKMLLRFADTRVLPNLPRILTPTQWAAISDCIEHWAYFDRSGSLAHCQPTHGECSNEILLNPDQLDQFLETLQSDAMMSMIIDSMPDVVPDDMKKSALYEIIAAANRLAKQHNVVNECDAFSLAVAACLSNGKSNVSRGLSALLAEHAWQPGTLGEHLVDMHIIE